MSTPEKEAKIASCLDQLNEVTIVVADSGDFQCKLFSFLRKLGAIAESVVNSALHPIELKHLYMTSNRPQMNKYRCQKMIIFIFGNSTHKGEIMLGMGSDTVFLKGLCYQWREIDEWTPKRQEPHKMKSMLDCFL